MTRMHKLYRHSVTSGKCEDCGLIDSHSNACHDAAPIRKIEALYDENDKLLLQNRDLQQLFSEVATMFELTTRQDVDGLLRARIQEALAGCVVKRKDETHGA